MKFRLLISVFFLMVFQVTGFIYAQSVKKSVFVSPEIVKTMSESDFVLLDSVYQIVVSPVIRYPLITSLTSENDSLRVILADEDGKVNTLIFRTPDSNDMSYPWIFAATGTLALLILLYFVRF